MLNYQDNFDAAGRSCVARDQIDYVKVRCVSSTGTEIDLSRINDDSELDMRWNSCSTWKWIGDWNR